jgi:N-methylhydantoinase A
MPLFLLPIPRLRSTQPRVSRRVWFEGDWRDTRIWSRLDLPGGAEIAGPAILEQPDATTVIEPGYIGRVDPLGNVIVRSVM